MTRTNEVPTVKADDGEHYPVTLDPDTLKLRVDVDGKIVEGESQRELDLKLNKHLRAKILAKTQVKISEPLLALRFGRIDTVELRGYHRKSGEVMYTDESVRGYHRKSGEVMYTDEHEIKRSDKRGRGLGRLFKLDLHVRELLEARLDLEDQLHEIDKKLAPVEIELPYFHGGDDESYVRASEDLLQNIQLAKSRVPGQTTEDK